MFSVIFTKLLNLIVKVMIKVNFSVKLCRYINDFHHYYVKNKLKKYFKKAHNELINNKYYNKNNFQTKEIIWTFWWQGTNKMPIIVKQCIHSMRKCNPNRKIIVITKYNFNKYINISSNLISRLDRGNIGIPHFSDIVRFKLLEKYGGLWIDSTIFCNRCLGNKYFDNVYTSGGQEDLYHTYVSNGKWSSFLIGGSKHNDIFIFMNNFYNLYLRGTNKIIDYFLLDYALYYVYINNIGNFKTYVDDTAYINNPHIYDLEKNLNKTYDSHLYYNISNNTDVFKLTYKKEIFNKKNSFYNKIINK